MLEALEATGEGDLLVEVAYLASMRVPIGEDELRGSLRRALLLLATGGDPRRELDPGGRPVHALAADLDLPERREALAAALAELDSQAAGLPRVSAAIRALMRDHDLAWRRFAAAVLADELAGTSFE